MPLLRAQDQEFLKKEFQNLVAPVKLRLFIQGLDCEACPMTKELLEDLAALDERITLETHNKVLEAEQVEKYNIQRVPAIVPLRVETIGEDGDQKTVERDYGIRFYGIPAGYEFSALVGDILDISRGDSGLAPASREALKKLSEPLYLQIFTTPG